MSRLVVTSDSVRPGQIVRDRVGPYAEGTVVDVGTGTISVDVAGCLTHSVPECWAHVIPPFPAVEANQASRDDRRRWRDLYGHLPGADRVAGASIEESLSERLMAPQPASDEQDRGRRVADLINGASRHIVEWSVQHRVADLPGHLASIGALNAEFDVRIGSVDYKAAVRYVDQESISIIMRRRTTAATASQAAPTFDTEAQRDTYGVAVELHDRGLYYCPSTIGNTAAARALVARGLLFRQDGVRHEESGNEVRGFGVVGRTYPDEAPITPRPAPPVNLAEARRLAREAQERAEKATPGPWEPSRRAHWDRKGTNDVCDFDNDDWVVTKSKVQDGTTDAVFVARARTDVPTLAAHVLQMADEIERLRAVSHDLASRASIAIDRRKHAEDALMSVATMVQNGHEGNGPAITDLVIADIEDLNRSNQASKSAMRIRSMVVDDIRERDRFGTEKYGRRLRANDGRDSAVDAYQEALDGASYYRKAVEEGRPYASMYKRALDLAIATRFRIEDERRSGRT